MLYTVKTINDYQAGIQKMDGKLKLVRAEMNKLIESYNLSFSEPLVHLTKHVASGMIQLRWRMPGTQTYFELEKEVPAAMSMIYKEVSGGYDIFYFESKRVSLNTDYSLFFNARKKYKRSRDLSQSAMRLKHRSEAQRKNV